MLGGGGGGGLQWTSISSWGAQQKALEIQCSGSFYLWNRKALYLSSLWAFPLFSCHDWKQFDNYGLNTYKSCFLFKTPLLRPQTIYIFVFTDSALVFFLATSLVFAFFPLSKALCRNNVDKRKIKSFKIDNCQFLAGKSVIYRQ